MGSFFGGGSAKRAARAQAAVIKEKSRLDAVQNNRAVEASASQMATAQAQNAATKYAEELLSAPAETADVNVAVQDGADDGNLLQRRRTVRSTYQSRTPATRTSGLSVL